MTTYTVELFNSKYDIDDDGEIEAEVYILADIDDATWTVRISGWGVREL